MPKRKQDELTVSSGHPSDQTPAEVPAGSGGPRKVLPDFTSLEKLVNLLRTCKRVVVVTGAGISVSCGIPDFRSEHGVYDLVSRLDLGLSSAEDLFDLEFFVDDPEPFFKFAKVLYPGNYVPSLTHRFIKALENRGKLLRNFTQNIDGLEAQVGLKKYVACHGSFLTASCLKCKRKRTAEDIREEVMQQRVPRCPSCQGVVKPDITFFGERLPANVKRAVEADHKKADLFLVLGTSLKVQPVSRILQFIPPHVPQVLVNRELIRPPRRISDGFDLHLLGDCDDVIQHLCDRLGWELPPLSPPADTPPALPITPTILDSPAAAASTMPPEGVKGEGMGNTSPAAAAAAAAAGTTPPEGVKGEEGDSPHHPPSLVPPTFVPPNSYTFPSSRVSGTGGMSAAWTALGGGGEAGNGNADDKDTDFEEVITCDRCDKVVVGDVYVCSQCFGYDLCGMCHGGGSNDHARETGHAFHLVER
ncbi:unnamed protein product [Ectocarpus sp. 12 AP-2014]